MAGIVLALLVASGFFCVWNLQLKMDALRAATLREQDQLMLRSPGAMKKLSLEYAPLLGALYWTRAVQYYGEKHHLHDQNLQLLWPLLDITTTLDPNLVAAYRFGSVFLSDAPPRGAGEPDLAVQLLQRGIAANPDVWRLYQDLGNVYYFDKKDYLKASQAFETGSRFPGAPLFMKIMAAKIAAEGESLETSYALWLDIYHNAANEQVRNNAEEHLKLVKAELDLREIDRRADEYENRSGKRATRIEELVEAGLLPGAPRDPQNYPYVIGDDGKAAIHPESPLLADWIRERN
jgi:hypothetical protein